MTPRVIDLDEQRLLVRHPSVLKLLLADKTTGKNIVWASDDYAHFGEGFLAEDQILPECVTGEHAGLIRPRIQKTAEEQLRRTRSKAEVFTPSWTCNAQNSLVDDAWFGRKQVFNVLSEDMHAWSATTAPIEFAAKGLKTWKRYVDERRLEITCGEAPYLASRYDAVTGNSIELSQRIGLLDRKLRVVGEQCADEAEWIKWAQRAVESIYGFEYQGDSLLLARENILLTYLDYREAAIGLDLGRYELEKIANRIAWNIWQMDGLTYLPPFKARATQKQPSLFDYLDEDEDSLVETGASEQTPWCQLKDWRGREIVTFKQMVGKGEPRQGLQEQQQNWRINGHEYTDKH